VLPAGLVEVGTAVTVITEVMYDGTQVLIAMVERSGELAADETELTGPPGWTDSVGELTGQ